MMLWLWAGFLAFIGVMLWVDLGLTGRKLHRVGTREALTWTAVCVVLALAFTAVVYVIYERGLFGVEPVHVLGAGELGPDGMGPPEPGSPGKAAAIQFLTAWVIEYSLSLDNIFVIALIFGYFRVPGEYQHRVLFWGVLGAVLLRGVLIIAGMELIHLFEWLTYPLGALLLYSAGKMIAAPSENPDFESNIVVRTARRVMPVTSGFDSVKFFVRLPPDPQSGSRNGRWAMTTLMLVLVVVTVIDTVFALDSIPAVFAVTRDSFIAFTSNIFAVLGLRSLYFALAAVIDKFKYLKISLVVVLAYVGLKMIAQHFIEIDTRISLAVVVGVMALGVVASIIGDRLRGGDGPLGEEVERVARLTLRQARKAVVLMVGVTVVIAGIAMLVLPGPGLVVIPLGLAILAVEFVWARHLLAMFKEKAAMLERSAEQVLMRRPRPWMIPLVFGASASVITGLLAFDILKVWSAAITGAGLLIGEVIWANRMLTRYRHHILHHPAAERADARPPIWIVPLALGATVALLLWLMYRPLGHPGDLLITSIGLLVGEAVWAAMWTAAWMRAVPPHRRPEQ